MDSPLEELEYWLLKSVSALTSSSKEPKDKFEPTEITEKVEEESGITLPDYELIIQTLDHLVEFGCMHSNIRDESGTVMNYRITGVGSHILELHERAISNDDYRFEVNNTRREIRALILISGSLLNDIEQYRELILGNNRLSSRHPEHKEQLIEFLERLNQNLQSLVLSVQLEGNTNPAKQLNTVKRWRQECWEEIKSEISIYTSPQAVAKAVLPTGVILGLGAIGALIGGSIGFGAGSITGQLIMGHAKPNEISKQVEKAMTDNAD